MAKWLWIKVWGHSKGKFTKTTFEIVAFIVNTQVLRLLKRHNWYLKQLKKSCLSSNYHFLSSIWVQVDRCQKYIFQNQGFRKQRHHQNINMFMRFEESPRTHVAKFYGRLRLIRSVLRASKFSVLKLIEIVILRVYYSIPSGFSLFRHLLGITFQLFKQLCLAKDHWRGFSTRNAHMVHIVNLIRFKMMYTS